MEKQFVNYEIALKLKRLGFDGKCIALFDRNGEISGVEYIDIIHLNGIRQKDLTYHYPTLAPLFQQAMDWFRKEHLIDILILPQDQSACDPLPLYFFAIVSYKTELCVELYNSSDKLHYVEFSEAREAAILKAINIIENETN